MAQADVSFVDNGTGQAVRGSINDLLQAAMSASSGSTPPPDPIGGQPWNWFADPEWGRAIRTLDNTAWLFTDTYGLTEPPGTFRNEAAGYPVGAFASTATATYWHVGGGNWLQVGTGTGGGGSAQTGQLYYDMGPLLIVDPLDAGATVDFGNAYFQEAA